MMAEINFVWDITEENFRRMMAEEQTSDIFGTLRFGMYLVEFRCTVSGLDDDYHIPTTDVYIYGESGPEEYELCNGAPYRLLEDEIRVPKRRTLDAFKRSVENIVYEMVNGYSEIKIKHAYVPTKSYADWNPVESKGEVDEIKPGEMRIPTIIGDIVIQDKGYTGTCGYPGVYIGLDRGKVFDIAMVEVDQDDADEEPLLKCHVYSNEPSHDYPIFDLHTDAQKIDKCLRTYL